MDSEEIYPLPKTPLYSVLRWILDQLNTSSFDFIAEEGDDSPVHTIVLGQGASRYGRQRSSKNKWRCCTALAESKIRLLCWLRYVRP